MISLSKREKVRFDSKWIWVIIIVFGGIIGSMIYFYFKGEAYEDSSED
ncbi:MAG: PLDc N-terminal domain-containing protein [Tenericutes bacterium]|nr:PLDc N-terminal domain-containing protein [Mycoplasmatota bacterium]